MCSWTKCFIENNIGGIRLWEKLESSTVSEGSPHRFCSFTSREYFVGKWPKATEPDFSCYDSRDSCTLQYPLKYSHFGSRCVIYHLQILRIKKVEKFQSKWLSRDCSDLELKKNPKTSIFWIFWINVSACAAKSFQNDRKNFELFGQ